MRKQLQRGVLALTVGAMLALGVHRLQAQDDGAPPMPGMPPDQMAAGGPGDNGPMPMDPARMQALMLERIKKDLGATDEEWSAIAPLLSDVMKLRQSVRPAGMGPGGPGGPGGPPPAGMTPPEQGGGAPNPAGPRPQADSASPEAKALNEVVEKAGATNEEIKAKLTAFREARTQQEQALKAAREKLQAVLSVKQEAILVLDGILE